MQETSSAQGKDILNKTIGDFVAEDYRTAAVFEKYGIDFCCGGQATLAATCREKCLDLDAVKRELETAKSESIGRSQNYGAWELPFLADYIVNTHHAYLNAEMGQIAAYTRKIAEVHGVHHPEVIEIAAIFEKIAADMVEHLREEEDVLFPTIKRIYEATKSNSEPSVQDHATLKESLKTLHLDHDAIGEATHAIRHLTKDYSIPDDVCNTFVVTYQKLKEFEDDLHKHVHLENNILFPKAAQL